MESFTTIGLGVVSGVLSSALLVLLGFIFTKGVIPWYQRTIYKGVDLEGRWIDEKDLNGVRYQYQLTLKQNAHDLTGTMVLSKTGSQNGDYVQPFKVSGSTWEGFATLNFQSSDRKSLSFATALLTVDNLGNNLTGSLAYRSRTNNSVASEDISWSRQS